MQEADSGADRRERRWQVAVRRIRFGPESDTIVGRELEHPVVHRGAGRFSTTRIAAPTTGSLDVVWQHGTRRVAHGPVAAIQVHHYDEHTVILRQSKTTNYEAPFLFLLFGNQRASLLDTGATEDPEQFPLRRTVDDLIAAWLARHPRGD